MARRRTRRSSRSRRSTSLAAWHPLDAGKGTGDDLKTYAFFAAALLGIGTAVNWALKRFGK